MNVLVSDTSVLIDLERGGLLETAFSLPVDFAVPDLLYNRELQQPDGERLLDWGLRIETLSAERIFSATSKDERVRVEGS